MNDSMPDQLTALDADRSSVTALLVDRGAERLAHPGGTLLEHLQRTASRLESWGASCELVAAGLCHAAYGTQGYPTALVRLGERELLRSHIGDEAEAIVYAYCARDRAHDATTTGELRNRFSGEYWVLSERLHRQLAELAVANELDVAEHGALSNDELATIREAVVAVGPKLSQASWSTLLASASMRNAALHADPPRGDHEIAFRSLGTRGAQLLLWHGGATPELTWARQHSLSADFQLRIPWRRGFAPSVTAARQDWAADALDLLRVMPHRAHVIAHSYGGVSALLAAVRAPGRFASLTVIEPPLWSIAVHDPDVQRLAALGRAFADGSADARTAFLGIAGLPLEHPETLRTERLARGFRDPGEASPPLARLRASGIPVAIVSGAHGRAMETLCDALGSALAAQRWIIPGAGHAVQRTPAFNERLRSFFHLSA